MKLIKLFGKTGLLLSLLLMCLISITVSAQSTVYKSANFGTVPYTSAHATIASGVTDNTQKLTIEAWVKQKAYSTNTQTIVQSPINIGGAGNVLKLSIQANLLSGMYGGTPVQCTYPTDTDWHHVAFICDKTVLGSTDSLSLYVDGTRLSNLVTPHVSLNNNHNINIGISQQFGISAITDTFIGHMSMVAIYDTILYTSTFVPDCVFDTAHFFYDTTIKAPCVFLLPLSGTNLAYYSNPNEIDNVTNYVYYTYNTSPCAPVYTFSADTSALDSVTNKATNHNYSYMKGAHADAHYNGWDTSLHITNVYCPNIIYGYFVDSITVYTDTVINYYSEYFKNTSPHIDTVTTSPTLVNTIYQTGINVYPSPASDYINISCQSFISAEVIDLTGRVFVKSTEKKLLVQDIPTGNYLLKIMSLNSCVVTKISVIH